MKSSRQISQFNVAVKTVNAIPRLHYTKELTLNQPESKLENVSPTSQISFLTTYYSKTGLLESLLLELNYF